MGGSNEPPFLLPYQDSSPEHVADQLAHPGPEGDSAALSAPAYTQETNPTTTGDHHAKHNTRRRTVHRRKRRGRTESNS